MSEISKNHKNKLSDSGKIEFSESRNASSSDRQNVFESQKTEVTKIEESAILEGQKIVITEKQKIKDSENQKPGIFKCSDNLRVGADLEKTGESKWPCPTPEQIKVLSTTELIGFRLAERMNKGRLKDLMTFFQRHIGSLWIKASTYNLINIFGLENFEKTDPNRPILLVANHRSYFDMYVVSAMLFRKTKRRFYLYFPVRARFFYDSPLGWFVNFIMGWFSMFPPFFRETKEAKKREFDKFSLRFLVHVCSESKPNIIGFHPEGKRNLSDDPYSFLPAQPGIGKVIMEAKPQTVPIFIAGLGNNLLKQIIGNWTGGEKIRIWFGDPIDFSIVHKSNSHKTDGHEIFGFKTSSLSKPNQLRAQKELADFLMEKIKELAEKDRLWMGKNQ